MIRTYIVYAELQQEIQFIFGKLLTLSAFCEVGGVSVYWKRWFSSRFNAISSSLWEYVHISVRFSHTQQGFRNKFMKRQNLGIYASWSVTIATTSVQSKKLVFFWYMRRWSIVFRYLLLLNHLRARDIFIRCTGQQGYKIYMYIPYCNESFTRGKSGFNPRCSVFF